MENGKFITIILILTGMLSIPVFNSSAYDDQTTHPALTQEIIKLFEVQYSQYQFTDEEKKILEQGSEKEDSPNFRCLAHFYDPIYEQGLYRNISAKDWAEATKVQAVLDLKYTALLANVSQDLFASETDFSFDRAVFEYAHGDKLRGLESLGHILHLIEDMAVPAHTRADAHPLGSPFEEYAKQWTKDNLDIADGLILQGEEAIVYNNLDDYFYNLALFSNQNFFSKDTIFDKRYSEPIIDYEKTEILSDNFAYIFGYENEENGKVVRIKRYFNFITGKISEEYFVKDINNLIFTDNWDALSKQAVLYGAGVMRLFFEAVEEEKQTLALYKKNRSGFDTVVAGAVDIGRKTASLFSNLAESVRKTLAGINPQDMVAGVRETQGGGGDFVAEVVGESQQLQPQNRPEDPNSPELQRLALILREAERMIARLEKDVDGLRKQNVGGAVEELVINIPVVDKVGKIKTKEPVSNPVNHNYGGGGGGGATPAPAPVSSSPPSSSASQASPTQTASTTTPSITINPPTIISPANFSQFTTSVVSFSGTASSTQIISTDFSLATTTANQNDDWNFTLTDFEQGTTTVKFFAGDGQNTSSSTEIEIFIDAVAPDIPSLEINQCDNSMLANSCLITTTTLDILWATTTISDDFSHFNFDNNGIFSISTATTTQATNLDDDATYTFSVAVVDINGNSSATTTKTATINQMPIVINEIAWAGTEASSADEWIELYNRSDVDIDLDDWMLYSQDGSPNISLATTSPNIISATGYYLIERTDDTTVSDVDADLVVPFSGWTNSSGLGDGGEHLILAYKKPNQATTTVDEAPFAGDWIYESGRYTLERYNPDYICVDIDDCRNNWGLPITWVASYDLLNGLDASTPDANIILGTPRARNSINYKIVKDNTLTEDKTITKDNSPYFVGADGLTIQTGKTLTIGEGVIIKTIKRYGDAEIVVNGTIQANGLVSEPVIFTVFSDDEGGDTNGDGACVSPQCPSDGEFWSQIIFSSASQNSEFNYTVFRYGGNRLRTTYPTAMVIMDGATANFTNSTFENSYTSGAYFESATSIISNCTFQNNKTQIAYNDYSTYYGLVALNGDITVQNSTFDNNYIGLYLSDSVGAEIISNTFNNNTNYPIKISGSPNITITGNAGENNEINAINIFGAMTNTIATTTLSHNSLPYILDNALTVSINTVLEIGPRTVFKFDGGSIGGSGQININGGGNEADRISFASISDNVVSQSGIIFSSSTPVIKNAEFRYLDRALSFVQGDLVDLNLEDVRFENNTWSIYADNQNAQVTFVNNLVFATTTSQSMNAAVKTALQDAKYSGANITW